MKAKPLLPNELLKVSNLEALIIQINGILITGNRIIPLSLLEKHYAKDIVAAICNFEENGWDVELFIDDDLGKSYEFLVK